ncbi:MAG TPA: serine hydrolase domain-containing protein [Puia sp.]|jgi:CubicO group peptidase (beta-lactamase class C family)|nr:serine hydrolase domain-containing protein [Puia sp.]
MSRHAKNRLFFIIIFLATCYGCGSDWKNAVSRQNNQPGSIAKIDSIVEKFMEKYDMPGLSIAIAKNDSLLYVKGYGYADISSQKEVTDSSLFRIGCLSQPITAMAILKLVQERKIYLDEKVFGDGAILGNDYGSKPYDARVKEITVKELLDHCAGWENNDNTLLNSSLSASQMLRMVVDSVALQSSPGKNFNFSYLGYVTLGKIIEKVTGKPYAEYIHSEILDPAGDSGMKIAGQTMQDRQKNEVAHYVRNFWNDNYEDDEYYTQNISNMQAACGWLGSATDMIKLLVRVDKFAYKPDIFNDSIMKIMFTPYDSTSHFSCGWWSNNKFNNWFAVGDYWATPSEMARADNGYCWVMLTNKAPQHIGADDDLDKMIWEIIGDSTILWPKKDLFLK